MPCTPFYIDFEVTSHDDLRMITFGMSKHCPTGADGDPSWVIHFLLQERDNTSQQYIDRVKVDVGINADDSPAADKTATNDLNSKQRAHLRGPGMEAADQLQAKEISQDDFNDIVGHGTVALA